ncbi:2664_t:CDS:10 [Entrophospora sp. SA101]|nr:9242_t:CDS:10 [Entrophospora sp. SA101]CAJ0905510.1 2664_t:CDS:10 [Entrophospora sp. SA101]
MSFLGSFQCNLLYYCNYPEGSKDYVPKPTEYGIPYKDVILTTSDNVKIHVYDLQHGDDDKAKKRPTILYFHTKKYIHMYFLGECWEYGALFRNRRTILQSILLQCYNGSPTEKGLKIDAQTVLDYIKNHEIYKNSKVIVFGQSLGGAVSIDLVDGLIVENTFLSIPKLLPHVMPPLRHFSIFCTQKWESEKSILNIKRIPILFLSGELDELIPKDHVQEGTVQEELNYFLTVFLSRPNNNNGNNINVQNNGTNVQDNTNVMETTPLPTVTELDNTILNIQQNM